MKSERFAVCAHVLAYLAFRGAVSDDRAVATSELRGTLSKNPTALRRVLAHLARAGLVSSRTGLAGGYWLARPAATISLDAILQAVQDRVMAGRGAGFVAAPIDRAIAEAERAALSSLALMSVADLAARSIKA